MTIRIIDGLPAPPGQGPELYRPVLSVPTLALVDQEYSWTVSFPDDGVNTLWVEFHAARTAEDVMPPTALTLQTIDSSAPYSVTIALDTVAVWYTRAIRVTPLGPILGPIRRIGVVHEIGAGVFDHTFDHTFE